MPKKYQPPSSQEAAIWAVRQNRFVTTEDIEKEFNCTNERARRVLRYLRDAPRFKSQIKKIETSSGRECYAVHLQQIDRPYADCNKRQTELLRRRGRPRAPFRRAVKSTEIE